MTPRCELEDDVYPRSNLTVKSSVPSKQLSAKQRVKRSPTLCRPVYVLGTNVKKNEVARLRPLLQRVSLARGLEDWTGEGGTPRQSHFFAHRRPACTSVGEWSSRECWRGHHCRAAIEASAARPADAGRSQGRDCLAPPRHV